MAATKLAPPFPYFGGKQSLAARIVNLFPAHDHYVEPFAGSLSVLLAKPLSVMETINDLDEYVMTFWRVLRDRPGDLVRVCTLTPHARAEQSLARCLDGLDELEVARRVWVALTQGRSGKLRPTGWRTFQDRAVGSSMPDYLDGYVSRLLPVAERLRKVSLEAKPALDIIAAYGQTPGLLLYCDPPYLANTRTWGNNYRIEMRQPDEHRELAEALNGCKAHVLLSGYASDLYDRELYADWNRVELAASTGNGTVRERTEVIWANCDIAAEHLFSDVSRGSA